MAIAVVKTLSISAVSTDDYINNTEDESDITISGTSAGLTTGDTVTVAVDGSGTDVSGLTGTTDSDGDWSVTLTSAALKALDATTPDSDGEDLTITASATGATDATHTVTYDPTAPTVSTVAADGTTATVTMSESIYAGTMPDGANFTITRSSNAPTVSTVAGIPATAGAADNSFTLTLAAAAATGDTLNYTQSGTDGKIPRDAAGNKLAAFSGQAMTVAVQKTVSVSAVSTDDYINNAEDESAVTISGTSTGLTSGTTVTVGVDGAGTDISGKTGTTDSDGDWSVSLTSAEVKAVDATTPDSDGEDLTVTATAPSATSGTRTVTYDPTAPTVTSGSTGYYSDSALGTALSGNVVTGGDIYTKMTFSEEVAETASDTATARPELYSVVELGTAHTYAGSASDITLDSTNVSATGVTANSTGIYVVNDGSGATDKVFAYNLDGTRKSGSDFALTGTYTSKTGITFTGNKFYLLDSTVVDVYSAAGTRDTSATFGSNNSLDSGLTTDGTKLYYAISDYIATTSFTGGGSTTMSLADGNDNQIGIAHHNGYLYVVDSADDKVYVYTTSGTHQSAMDFNLTTDNANPTGITALANGDLLVTDSNDNKLYRYRKETATQYDIIASGSVSDGDCVESGDGASDDKQYTCRYTVKSGDRGTFKARAGTQTTDKAGNPLASTYTHTTGLTLNIPKTVSISAVSTDDYINDTEDENAVTISGTSTGLTSGDTVTVGIDGSGTDVSGLTGTTNSAGTGA